MARVLIVDDDPEILELLRLHLEQQGHACLLANRGNLALKLIREEHPELVITDVMMPGLTGGALYEAIRRDIGPHLPVIISTGTSLRFRTEEDELTAFYPKQNDYDELMSLVQEMLRRREYPQV